MRIDSYNFFIKKPFLYVYKFFGVKRRSYVGSIVKRIYDYYCGGAINLFKEYKRFYKNEFDTYEEFLSLHYNLDEKLAPFPKNLMCKDISIRLDSTIEYSMEFDEIKDLIKEFLEINNEN